MTHPGWAVPLPPTDPAVASNLVVWLADPASNFEDGTWHDLSPNRLSVQTATGQTDPAALVESPESGVFAGQSFSSLFFSDGVGELMHADTGRATFSDLTAVVVYRSTAIDADIRPFGIGSNSPDSPTSASVPHFNMGCDPSIRKDNGSIAGHSAAHPDNQIFIRTSVFDSSGGGSIREYFDGVEVLQTAAGYYTVNSGHLFLGDVRNSSNAGDLSIAEVILFDRALTAAEVAGTQDYLLANITTSRPAPRVPGPPDPEPASVPSARPNILLIVTDDHGSIDLNCFGATDLSTPNLDGLAAGGLKFTQFTVAAPLCTPSRGAFLTGRYPKVTGITGNANGMPQSEFTLAEVVKERGYHTGLFGKWHLGDTAGEPLRHGFDSFFGFLKGTIENYEHDRLSWTAATSDTYENRLDHLVAHDLWRDDTSVNEDGTHFGNLIVRETNAFMEAHQSDPDPFFIYAAFNTPHYPVQPFQNFYNDYDGLPEPRRSYAALVSTLDFQIGQILDKLDDLGLADDTLVIFFGDHGHSMETRTKLWNPDPNVVAGGGDNGPYRGNKGQVWEGGVRVPAIIRWPSVISAGGARDQLVMSVDLVPTVANLLGVDLPNRVDGRDIFPVISSPTAASPHSFVYYTQGSDWAVREGPWKLVTQSGATLLANLDLDVGETTNYSSTNPGVRDRLQRMYNLWSANPNGNHNGISAGESALSDLAWATESGSLHRDYSPSASSLLLADGSFSPKGVSAEGDASLTLKLGGLRSRFRATLSHEDSSPAGSAVEFEIWGDGSLLYSSSALTPTSVAVTIDLDVTGINSLILLTTGSTGSPIAVWAGARVESTTASLSQGLMDANGRSSLTADPPPASSPLGAMVSVELVADVPGVEYYLEFTNDLAHWRNNQVNFADGIWTITGGPASVEETHDLGAGRWRIVFGLPSARSGFARMKIRAVDGS